MLMREATVSREVMHAHLAAVLSAEAGERGPRIVMPYYEGVSLDRLLRVWRYSQPRSSQVLGLARQIAEAVAALHRAGWLHGQLFARHVVVSPQGQATLMDLTAARRLESQECDAGWPAPVTGAPSPELLSRQRLTAAADIYALGLILFELVCGRAAFEASSAKRLAWCHLRERPAEVRTICGHVPLELNELVCRMLAKEPLRRPSAAEVVRWLAEVEIAELASFQ
jgi:serine/threonine-protein kinase